MKSWVTCHKKINRGITIKMKYRCVQTPHTIIIYLLYLE